jgi:hypothetical protein
VVVQEYSVAHADALNLGTDLGGPADNLVTEHGTDLFRQIPRHEVAGADAARRRAHENLARALQPRHGRGHNGKPVRGFNERLPHHGGRAQALAHESNKDTSGELAIQ